MLSRPSDNGHTPFGDIYISYSPDMKYWGEHRCVMKVTPFPESALAVYKDWSRICAFPDRRRLADVLSRGYYYLQRFPLLYGSSYFG